MTQTLSPVITNKVAYDNGMFLGGVYGISKDVLDLYKEKITGADKITGPVQLFEGEIQFYVFQITSADFKERQFALIHRTDEASFPNSEAAVYASLEALEDDLFDGYEFFPATAVN